MISTVVISIGVCVCVCVFVSGAKRGVRSECAVLVRGACVQSRTARALSLCVSECVCAQVHVRVLFVCMHKPPCGVCVGVHACARACAGSVPSAASKHARPNKF